MPIESGRYIITHAQYWNLACLSDANDGTSLTGCLEQDLPGEEWNVKELRNGRYSIVNFGHKMSASAEFHSKMGDHVVGRESDWLWLITERDSGKYTISTANGKLRWFLEDDWPKTPITVHDAPPSDPRCHWTFQRIGRINTVPYKAAKEEAAQAKAEVVRTLAELEAAKREVEKTKEEAEGHKSSFSSYFNMMSQLYIRQNTISDVLDYEQLGPIQVSLFWAAEMGHNAAAKSILAQQGVNVNCKTTDGRTPLFIAAQNGHDGTVRLLLAQEGVNVDSKSTNGSTPLSIAAENGHDAAVRLLLVQERTNVNSKNINGSTPLSNAAYNGHDVVVQLILAQDGVDINSKHKDGLTPLSFAALAGHAAVVRLLLAQRGIVVNSKDRSGSTPLLFAARNGHDAVVRLLLAQECADVNIMSNDGHTPLMWAEKRNHKAIARLLRERIRQMGNATNPS